MGEIKDETFNRRMTEKIARELLSGGDAESDMRKLNESLRLLAKWRSILLQEVWLKREGSRVTVGPFRGMRLAHSSGEGCHIAKLIGIYEQPLWSIIDTVVAKNYDLVLNVGAAEGYYAIGLACRMPKVHVLAHESNRAARQILERLIEVNGVSGRVFAADTLLWSDLQAYEGRRLLVVCDIEGGEFDLFAEPAPYYLRHADLIIEIHDSSPARECTAELVSQFSATHEIKLVEDDGMRSFQKPVWFKKLPHLDQLICTWEWRSIPTPWLVLTARECSPNEAMLMA
jgi:hypothetical protein